MTTGMEGFAAGASALAGQAAGLRAAVDSGKVRMTPDAAEELGRFYEEKADKVQALSSRTDRLIATGAFGDCFIGRQLEKKFDDKVNAPEVGILAILDRTQQILRDMAQAYRDSARDMQNTDDDHSRNLNRSV
ncbi:hypothetical protein SAMN02982929_06197 [Saccharopolyspora kobensis]|uniref:Excreted virulence factor EspC (Type VII ESX diderm) n=1 Tax=Saccharopolyspora kobensis TaxID=146035 RepID=A0A1H6EDV4_9PSEU|nr:hypothetical protein [Saccharopolyspora kobensis]SEG95451.1 hypothetical protein SAMN02982929_06197 [Saccharopolyspora kobensis]SFD56251.1 hypothetical protein SAMN05216506_10589 [Saccharopolyspora kobensis]